MEAIKTLYKIVFIKKMTKILFKKIFKENYKEIFAILVKYILKKVENVFIICQ